MHRAEGRLGRPGLLGNCKGQALPRHETERLTHKVRVRRAEAWSPPAPGGQLANEPLGPDLSPWHHRGWVRQQGTETATRRGQPWGAHTLNPTWAPGSASASFKHSAPQASRGPSRAQAPVGDRGSRGWAGRPPAPRERRPQVQPPPGVCSQPPRPALPPGKPFSGLI